MKKLSLKKLNLEANDLLQRKQLKTIFGGDGGYEGNCIDECPLLGECPPDHVCVTVSFADGCKAKRCLLSFS